jgi:hypothetical protein
LSVDFRVWWLLISVNRKTFLSTEGIFFKWISTFWISTKKNSNTYNIFAIYASLPIHKIFCPTFTIDQLFFSINLTCSIHIYIKCKKLHLWLLFLFLEIPTKLNQWCCVSMLLLLLLLSMLLFVFQRFFFECTRVLRLQLYSIFIN